MSATQTFFGESFLMANGQQTTAAHLDQFRLILLYFSASWAPPCINFAPVLAEFYSTVKKSSSTTIEVIQVSFDHSETVLLSSLTKSGWVAISPTDPRT